MEGKYIFIDTIKRGEGWYIIKVLLIGRYVNEYRRYGFFNVFLMKWKYWVWI